VEAKTSRALLILIAGPFRSGTNDDPALMGGSSKVGDDAFNEVFHPVAVRLLEKCDGVLRVGGASAEADEMVRVGRSLALPIYGNPAEIPAAK
jgi:hypothetical protein